MRPLRLEIEGFTSFAEHTELDFSQLDLFAITGPTGAGKSSLIDAIVFALYGWVPRVGKEYRQLISHGAERLAVQLDFQVGKDRFRVSRNVRKSDGRVQARLDQIVNGDAESLAGKISEIESAIEKIVGLDHDAFTRSVVLPQGEFDRFLKGKPEERRKILVSLLNLRVYEDMQRLAGSRAAAAKTEAEFIAKQLATDFADATPQKVAEQRKALKQVAAEQKQNATSRDEVTGALNLARSLRTSRKELSALDGNLPDMARKLRAAEEEEKNAANQQDDVERQLTKLAKETKATGFDEKRLIELLELVPKLRAYGTEAERLAEFQAQGKGVEKELGKNVKALASAMKEEPLVAKGCKKAASDLQEAKRVLEDLKRRHKAADLRQGLKRGDPCPVCERPLDHLPSSHIPGLEAAEGAEAAAQKELDNARHRQTELTAERKGLEKEKGRLSKEAAEVQRKLREAGKRLDSAHRDLVKAGFDEADLKKSHTLLPRLERQRQKLQEAKQAHDNLQARHAKLEQDKNDAIASLVAAKTRKNETKKQITDLERRKEKAQRAFESERDRLLALAERHGWDHVESPPNDYDEVDVLETLNRIYDENLHELSAQHAALEVEIRSLEKKIERTAELTQQRQCLNETAALAKELSGCLHANQFIAYIQEEALRVLAEDGSKHLETLSQGRYALFCKDQEFFVVDHWSADEVRSVKTLSGGESFLASLALALALAERLATFSSEGQAQQRLESLFLDEGFGTLDRETLDVVVQGIEALHGGQRMVGVVTHIPELAERMPVRVEVQKQHGRATVSVV